MEERPEFVTNLRATVLSTGFAVLALAVALHLAWHTATFFVWAAYCLGGTAVTWASFSALRAWHEYTYPRPRSSPLEIVFEPLNPARRFWSMESHRDDYQRLIGTFWEHRVEIRNNSDRTLRNVSVTVEHTGPLPQKPQRVPFTRTKGDSCDINPHCSELVLVSRWPVPKVQAGMPSGDSAYAYGPLVITASADDTHPATKVFDFNYQTEQMLFERGHY